MVDSAELIVTALRIRMKNGHRYGYKTMSAGRLGALPLLLRVRGQWELQDTAVGALLELGEAVAIAAIIGPARQGKSSLLNCFLRSNSFAVGHSTTGCTRGLWMCITPIVLPESGARLILIDAEGSHDPAEGSIELDRQLSLLSVAVSSVLLINTVRVVQEDHVRQLSFDSSVARSFTARKGRGTRPAPCLLWVLRDFYLDLPSDVSDLDEYLERVLSKVPGCDDAMEAANGVRRALRAFFTNRECIALPSPSRATCDYSTVDFATAAGLEVEFQTAVENLFNRLQSKCDSSDGARLRFARGALLVEYLRQLTARLNIDGVVLSVPVPDVYDAVCAAAVAARRAEIIAAFRDDAEAAYGTGPLEDGLLVQARGVASRAREFALLAFREAVVKLQAAALSVRGRLLAPGTRVVTSPTRAPG